MAQTKLRGTEELRHLIARRRPSLPPVYEALCSIRLSKLRGGISHARHAKIVDSFGRSEEVAL
jgi:hypothetical protein